MNAEFCVCVCNNSSWWLQDYGNDVGGSRLYWTIEPAAAHRFNHYGEAIELMQLVKHIHPEANVRLIEAPCKEAPHDPNPA